MKKYIGDGTVTLCLMGLRFIKKSESSYPFPNRPYRLEWNYKGVDGYAEYEKKEVRDAIYDKVQEALTEEKGMEGGEASQ